MKRSLALLTAFAFVAVALGLLVVSDRRPGARSQAVETDAPASVDGRPSVADAMTLATERAVAEDAASLGEAEELAAEPVEELVGVEGTGALWIQFESRETGEPISGLRLRALVAPMEEERSIVHATYSRGSQFESIVADELGKAVYYLPAGREIRLEWWEAGFPTSLASREHEPLAPHEDRDVLVRLSTEHDLAFVGRVVSAATNEPLPHARVYLRQGGRTLERVPMREEGLFQLATDSWRRPYLRIECAGHSPALIPVEAGHETVADALAIELGPTASMSVQVRDSGLFPLQVTVVVRVDFSEVLAFDAIDLGAEVFEWTAVTGADGRTLLEGLPPRTPLELEVFGQPFGHQREPEPIVLAPGETKEVVVGILKPGRLLGRLLDRDGRPVGNKEVWLLRSEEGTRYLDCRDQRPSQSVFTGPDGNFTFNEIYAGEYLVGPCPACEPERRSREPLPETFNAPRTAPLGFAVRTSSASDTEVELVVDRELELRISAVDEAGRVVSTPDVRVEPQDHRGQVGLERDPDDWDVRVAGPLQQGLFEVAARSGSLYSEPKLVKGGGELELLVQPARGRIAGRVVSPIEGMVYAFVTCWRLDDGASLGDSRVGGQRVDRVTGQFAYERLPTGTYFLEATGADLRATQRVTLDSKNGDVSGVLLNLDVGGQLVVATGQIPADDEDPVLLQRWVCQVVLEGQRPIGAEFSGPRSGVIEVPAGELTVHLWPGGSEEGQTRTVVVRPRQQRALIFTFD